MAVATAYKGPIAPSITSASTFNCSFLSANGSDLNINGSTFTLNTTELTFNCSTPSTTPTSAFTFKGPTFFHLLRSLNLPAHIGKFGNDWRKWIHHFRDNAVLHSDSVRWSDRWHSDHIYCGMLLRCVHTSMYEISDLSQPRQLHPGPENRQSRAVPSASYRGKDAPDSGN